MRLMSQKLYERQLREDQICKPNILKLGHQNHRKNTENRKNYCSRLYKKERKTFFNNLKVSNVTDNKTFWKNIQPIFPENRKVASKIRLVGDNENIISDD